MKPAFRGILWTWLNQWGVSAERSSFKFNKKAGVGISKAFVFPITANLYT